VKKNKHIGSSFEDYLKKRLSKEEREEIERAAREEVEKLRKKEQLG
jgi:hypothetical protein